ncbi:unnamed protein product [Schistosoma mattheei]|uniref:Uncharacterized protein n=1 Tax=Schistosoma mattheei TaxID=31246 RepID=A0AA85B4R2_9TREM|nr:unnamed protein product [Schistosoma mattheei]
MRSVFAKKSKTKLNPKTKLEPTIENELMLKSEEKHFTDEQNDNLQNKYTLRSKIIKHNSLDKRKSGASFKSSSSDVYIRRGLGVSVTFESTLPTQIWQASPSPSPPLSEQIKNDENNQGIKNSTSSSSNSQSCESSNERIRMNYKNRHGSLNDIHECDDSSDETNPSRLSYPSLSSCTSSDETTTSQERLSHRLSSSTSDSSSSLDLRILPNNGTHSTQKISENITKVKKIGKVRDIQIVRYITKLPATPTPGFGSGGSIGSETEDKDSGRGPSSGSEWGSGRGGSSNITLDRSIVEHTSSEVGLDYQGSQSNRRSRNVKSAEESQLGWYAPTGLEWSDRNFHPGEESLSRDSAFQSPNTDNLAPSLHVTEVSQSAANKSSSMQKAYPPSAITLTTITGNTPVLEMRHNGTPTLCARGLPSASTTDSLATSTTTCTTVVDIREGQDEHTNNPRAGPSTKYRVPTPDPSCWEPYKTVIHVNETSLEKFTLV